MSEKPTQKAGAIVLSSKNKNNIGIIFRFRQNDWSFPKGHTEGIESALETLKREMLEETNLEIEVIKALPDLNYINVGGESVSVKMFLAESKDDSKYKPEFDGDQIKWVSYNKVTDKLTYENLKEYFNFILPIVKKQILEKIDMRK